jgi:hypothetical protein
MVNYDSHATGLFHRMGRIFLICLAIASLSAAVLDTPLDVYEIAGVPAVDRPVSIVVPLLPNLFQDPGAFQVTNGVGVAIPAQIRAERRWWAKDNSLREVRVDFKATVPANGKTTYRLRLGANPVPATPIVITDNADQLTVDNGRVRFSVSKTSFNLLDEVWYQGNLVIDNTVADGAYMINRFGTRFLESSPKTDLTPTVIEVVEAGPVKARIRVERPSWFVHDASDPYYADFPKVSEPVPGFVCWFDVYYDDDHIRIHRLELNSGIVAWNNGHPGDGMFGALLGYNETGLALRTTLTSPEIRIANENAVTLVPGSVRAEQGSGTFSINGTASGTTGSFAMVSQGAGAGFMVSMPFFAEMQPNGWAFDPASKVFTALTAPLGGGSDANVHPLAGALYKRRLEKYIINDMSSQPSMLDLVFFATRPTDSQARATVSLMRNRVTGVTTLDEYRRTGATTDLFGFIPATKQEVAVTGQTDYTVYEPKKELFGLDMGRWIGTAGTGSIPYTSMEHVFQRPPKIHVDEIGCIFAEVLRPQYLPTYWAGLTTPTPYRAYGSGPDIIAATPVTPAHAGPEFTPSPYGNSITMRAFKYLGNPNKFAAGQDYTTLVPFDPAVDFEVSISRGRDGPHHWLQRPYDTPGDNPIGDHFKRASQQYEFAYAHQLLFMTTRMFTGVDLYAYQSEGALFPDASNRGMGNNLIEMVDGYAEYGDPDALTAIDYMSQALELIQLNGTNGSIWGVISFQDAYLLHGLLNALHNLPESSPTYKRIWSIVYGGGPARPGLPGLVDACIAGKLDYYRVPGEPGVSFSSGQSGYTFLDVLPIAGWLRATRPDPFTGIVETEIGKSYVQFMIDGLDGKNGVLPWTITDSWRTFANSWRGDMLGRMTEVMGRWEREPDPTKWTQALGLDPRVYPVVPVPRIVSQTTSFCTAGSAYAYTIIATQGATAYFARNLPSGLAINSTTGVISGTPAASGSFAVTVGATNASGSGVASLNLVVAPAAHAPVITSGLHAQGVVNTAFLYATSATNAPTSFAADGLPVGLVMNSSSGVITGTPTTVGTYVVTVRAMNAFGTDSKLLNIGISAIPLPIITSARSATAVAGVPFSYTITATGNPQAFVANGLPVPQWPNVLFLDATTGVISGTPTTGGHYAVTIGASTITPVYNTTLAVLELEVAPAPGAPAITSPLRETARLGSAYTYAITATNSPTSFTVSELPPGLVFDAANGVISGTPTAAVTLGMTISATNAVGTDTRTLRIATSSAPVPAITSILSASATVGAAFSYTITASQSPLSYSAFGLPAGLTLDPSTGLISGTPTIAASYAVTVGATNVDGLGTATLALTVAAAPSAPGGGSGSSHAGSGSGGGGGCGLGGLGVLLLGLLWALTLRQATRTVSQA